MAEKMMNITICMGSSCYSRGNARNIEVIREFVAQRGLDDTTELVGHLCQDQCRSGPNIAVDGKVYQQMDAAAIVSILQETGEAGNPPRSAAATEEENSHR